MKRATSCAAICTRLAAVITAESVRRLGLVPGSPVWASFGAFSVKKRDARQGRNPRTGESVDVSEKAVPFFKTGKQLRERLNTGK